MPVVSKVLNALAASQEMGRIGSAAYVAVVGAISYAFRQPSDGTQALTGHTVGGADTSAAADESGVAVPSPPFVANVGVRDIRRHLAPQQQIIVLSNREPCVHELTASGEVTAHRPAGGVVAALEPVVQACRGVWVAHGSGSADRLTADRHGHVAVASEGSSYRLRRVWLTAEEERGYYYGFANEGLWPLCHMAFSPPIFRRSDWTAYQGVNRRFADAIATEIRTEQPVVLVQDYHFALVPQFLRERRPDAITVAFWHIPWPHPTQFALCPFSREILDGLLGSSILGFQTPAHCRNFLECVDDGCEERVDRKRGVIVQEGRDVHVRSYPISVEWPSRWASQMPSIEECRRSVRGECGLDPKCALVVSIDRLDYTKGFEERLAAIERLLETSVATGRRIAFLQIAAPTRVAIQRYGDLAARIRRRVGGINQRFTDERFAPITYLERYADPAEVFRYYRAADVCYVGSLDDGMNLIAKEFVSARDDEQGALVLSRFAGAARELTDALLINPYDVDGVVDALARALGMTPQEQRSRMRNMRRWIADHNVYNWACEMLADAARVRQDELGPGAAIAPMVVSPHVM